jgi:hypothetical protein
LRCSCSVCFGGEPMVPGYQDYRLHSAALVAITLVVVVWWW